MKRYNSLLAITFTTAFFLGTGICLCEAQEANKQGSALGELKLQGKYIERLVLWRKDGHTERFDQPADTIKLRLLFNKSLFRFLKYCLWSQS